MFARRAILSLSAKRTFTPFAYQARLYAGGGGEEAASTKGLSLSFVTPYDIFFNGVEVDSVTVPAEEGRFGLQANHVPIMAQLKAGLIDIKIKDKTQLYFTGPGFITMHPSSRCEISVTEGFPVEWLDKQQAQQGLDEAKRDLAAAKDEKEKVEATIRVETFEAIISSV